MCTVHLGLVLHLHINLQGMIFAVVCYQTRLFQSGDQLISLDESPLDMFEFSPISWSSKVPYLEGEKAWGTANVTALRSAALCSLLCSLSKVFCRSIFCFAGISVIGSCSSNIWTITRFRRKNTLCIVIRYWTLFLQAVIGDILTWTRDLWQAVNNDNQIIFH